MRHAGILSALLATAALFCAIPGLMRLPAQQDRAAERLRPPQIRTLTVWLMPGDTGDRKLLGTLCAAFEKERPGARVFLRVVTADEFEGETAVLPDVALFETGDIAAPEKYFLPLAEEADRSGQFAGVQYAVPLWLAPNVLSLPKSWLTQEGAAAPRQASLLAASTAAPEEQTDAPLQADNLPWGMLLQQNAIAPPQGVGFQQLMMICPSQHRAQLVSAVLGRSSSTPVPSPEPQDWVTTLPFSSASPTPVPPITVQARVETLKQHQARLQNGEALAAYWFPTAVSDRVRYAALCRDGEDARAFVQFLLAHQADAPGHALLAADEAAPLPSAFAHTKPEILQLCADAFDRCEDPVQTLLRLR